ncbi:MAG: transposase family protein [Proteobacteria bacterium]|nr:transposase family protein [Pseudomonadota bacterium]
MLTPEEIAEAERVWIIQSQSKLTQDTQFDIWRKLFGLFLDEKGIWRCGGRLENAAIPYGTKHPEQAPFFITLVVRNAHERVLHNGVKNTLTKIRSNIWIVGERSFVNSVLHNCVTCRRFEGKPYQNPLPPPLPTFRVSEDPSFSSPGVDFAGPLYIKQAGSTASKVWICLYTCCTTWAIHLDIVPDMSTQTFINNLNRFCARRGLPCQFISDNGKTFKATAKVMETIVSQKDVQQYLSQVRVKWSFNLEKAPWWGGVFERMVCSRKRCLRKMIGR